MGIFENVLMDQGFGRTKTKTCIYFRTNFEDLLGNWQEWCDEKHCPANCEGGRNKCDWGYYE